MKYLIGKKMMLFKGLKYNQIVFACISVIFFNQDHLHAQTLSYNTVEQYDSIFKKANGLDQNLINGYQYFDMYPNAKGHAFIHKNEFLQGKVIVNSNMYDKVYLKYDILNQNVILRYRNHYGGSDQIVLHNRAISQFELEDKTFENLSFPETGDNYFQVISDSKIKCYYLWYKNIGRLSGSLDNYYVYSDQRKKTYLLIDDKLSQYNRNRSFVKIFPRSKQNAIKKYLKDNNIKLKSVPDFKVKELIKYCENLIND